MDPELAGKAEKVLKPAVESTARKHLSESTAKTISDRITKDNVKKAASVAQKLMGNRAVQEKMGRVLEVLGIGKKKDKEEGMSGGGKGPA